MAYIEKRNGAWRASVARKGIRKTATFDTRREAELWSIATENELLANNDDNIILASMPVTIIKVTDLFDRYAKEVSIKKRGYEKELSRLKYFIKEPIFDIFLGNFTSQNLAQWRDRRLLTVATSTINRDLNLISSIFNYAIKEWNIGDIDNPVQLLSRPKNPKPRERRISSQEQKKITDFLGWDKNNEPNNSKQWVAFSFLLALETAMRKGELLSIRWKDIHLDRSFFHLEITKNGEARDVPLSSEAKRLLNLITPSRKSDKVIPLSSDRFTKIFVDACKKTQIVDLHFHDTRREATTQLSKKLSNVLELSAVTGHKTLNILKVYYRPNPEDLAKKLD